MMSMKKVRYIFHLIGIGVVALSLSCNNGQDNNKKKNTTTKLEPAEAILDAKQLMRDGDLILRSDDDLVSLSLRNFSKTDKSYSHCGIAYHEDTAWYVYHLMAGDENPGDLMEREEFSSFVSPHMKTGFGLFRYQLNEQEQDSFRTIVRRYWEQKTKFDKKFDLKTDDVLYCAEMVYKGLAAATHGRVILPTTVRENYRPEQPQYKDLFFKRLVYVALDNLFLNPYCKEIKRYRYPHTSLEREQ